MILLAYLGSPNDNLTRANTLISTEIASMAKICRDQGFNVCIAKTKEDIPKSVFPSTGVELWDGATQPDILWLHQTLPNIPGGVRPVHDHTLDILLKVLPGVQKIYRLVIDNNESMNHKRLMLDLKSKGDSCYYLSGYKERGPNPGYKSLHEHIEKHISQGTFYETGYESAKSKTHDLNFKSCPLFSEQLILTRELFPKPEKDIDFCYIGASRSNEAKRKARLNALGEGFLSHENSFYGGTLFKTRSSIRFPKAWTMMSRSKAHLITRDAGMNQLPLHRYLQALTHESIPVVLNEPQEVEFIHSKTLQSKLRVKNYQEALELVSDYESVLPLLRQELNYWVSFDRSRVEQL